MIITFQIDKIIYQMDKIIYRNLPLSHWTFQGQWKETVKQILQMNTTWLKIPTGGRHIPVALLQAWPRS